MKCCNVVAFTITEKVTVRRCTSIQPHSGYENRLEIITKEFVIRNQQINRI